MWDALVKKFIKGLGCKPKVAMNLYGDNMSAIEIAQNPIQHDRT